MFTTLMNISRTSAREFKLTTMVIEGTCQLCNGVDLFLPNCNINTL